MRNSPAVEGDPGRFHAWTELSSNVKKMAAGARGTHYTQANIPRLIEGNVKLAFASFTPIEKGFFIGSAHGDERPFAEELTRWIRGETPKAALFRLVTGDIDGAAREVTAILRNDGPLRQLVQRFVMDYPLNRVRFLSGERYDYWTELLKEYDFLKARDGERCAAEIATPHGTRRVEGRYRLVEGPETLDEVFAADDETALLLTIEGGHVFSVGPDLNPLPLTTMVERVQAMKEWDHPVLFLTLAHHFFNGLCGHAHSLIDSADWIMDQEFGLNEDFVPDVGLSVVRELLDLDDQLRDRGGKRILIDVRHMSARARKTYYDEIVRPYNKDHAIQPGRHQRRFPKIPVIMSHCGYTGAPTLDRLIADQAHECDRWHRGAFYAWNINLSDEDIRVVHQSEGLVGLCFDRRILGQKPGQRLPAERARDLLIDQVLAIADVIFLDDRLDDAEKARAWDIICIGSDFDGVIHPLEPYPTALTLQDFAEDLRRRLREVRHTRQIDAIGVDELVEKIAWKNAYEFAMRHLPAAVGSS